MLDASPLGLSHCLRVASVLRQQVERGVYVIWHYDRNP